MKNEHILFIYCQYILIQYNFTEYIYYNIYFLQPDLIPYDSYTHTLSYTYDQGCKKCMVLKYIDNN